MGKKSNPLAARIKKVMQADEDVGKIAQFVPFLMGERFIAMDRTTCGPGGGQA
jgi:hypothetical protein